MYLKIIILSIALVVCFTALAMADGGFYGDIYYGGNGCGWDNHDQVRVENTDTGEYAYYSITQQGPAYNTANGPGRATWPPGHYRLVVSYHDPQCGPAVYEIVTHGSSDQKVSLIVMGPAGTPDGPQGP